MNIEETLKTYREKFVRDDGLIDKYYYGDGAEDDLCESSADAIEHYFAEKLQAYGEAKYREGYSKGVVEEGLDCYKHAKDAYNRGKKGLPFADPYTE